MKQEIDEELSFHIEQSTAKNIAAGMLPEEAAREARKQFGNVLSLREECREVRGATFGETLLQDVRFGARMLIRNPGFTAVVAGTLALGIGANAGLFSVVNGVLLNRLPFPQPEQLVTLHQSKPNFETGAIPYPNFCDWQSENRTFASMSIMRPFGFSLTWKGETGRVKGEWVSADFFTVLGVKPAVGRIFVSGEDRPGAGPVAVISGGLCQRIFGSASDAPGQSLTLDDRSYTVVGVLPAGTKLPFSNLGEADVYVPIGQWNHPGLQNRGAGLGLHGIGRLKAGATLAQAQADLDRVAQNLAAAYPDTNKGNGAKVIPLKERMVGNIKPALLMLLGAVGFVLLIACVNVSNLFLARSSYRKREFAIRAAVGASRWRLVRQSLTESMLFALVGGGLGLLAAIWGTKAALAALPTALPRANEVGLDGRVLFFTLAISILTGVVSGLAPAVKTSQWRLAKALKEGGRGMSGERVRTQGVLVAVEVALAMVLLIGAGLMVRSLSALWSVDPGFQPDNVLTFGLSLPPSMRTANPEAIRIALREISDNLNAVAGVKAVSFSGAAAPLQNEDDQFFWIAGQPKPASQSEMNMALFYTVEPGYTAAMGIPLKRGRFFTGQDNDHSPDVAVIDEVFARKYFGNADPIGQRLILDGTTNQEEIVGVVGHVKQWGLDSDDQATLQAQLYLPFRQISDGAMPFLAAGAGMVVRTAGGKPAAVDSIRRAVQNQNSQNIVYAPQTMNEIIAASLASRRFSMWLLEAFATVALLLASVGIYGVISCLVGQRTQELGLRLALGAQRADVLRLVLGQGMRMALAGVALGVVAALGLTRLIAKLLYGVSATDPATFAAIAVLLTVVAMLACFVPARRAAKVDPMEALRHE